MAPDTAIAASPQTSPLAPSSRAYAPAAVVRLEAVTKIYGAGRGTLAALDSLTLDIEKGSFTCVVGASGCGKTTLLNLIAGLDEPTSGAIEVTGSSALMFQESALFPWLTAPQATSSSPCGCDVSVGRSAANGHSSCSTSCIWRVGREAPARAVGWHAAARRAGPCARAGRRRAAHGRAVRRPRRDHPRPACTKSSRACGARPVSPSSSSRTTCAKRSASAIASCCSPAGPDGRPNFDVDLPATQHLQDSGVTTLATQ